MKRFLPITIVALLALGAFTGCQPTTSSSSTAPTPTPTAAAATPTPAAANNTDTTGTDAAATSADYKTGLGVITSVSSSKDATADKEGVGQVDSTIAVVTLDADGKIVKCSLDVAQTKVNFDASGAVTSDTSAEVKSKNELGAGYGMVKASGIGKEWNEQATAFADWTIGKTVAEVAGMTVKKVNDAHPEVPDVPELTSAVTVNVGEFIAAIEKAANNAKAFAEAPTGDIKTGLGIATSTSSSKAAAADKAGVAQVDSYVAAVTVDGNGKILSCSIDAAQTKVNFDAKGAITTDLAAEVKTKVELGAGYGMVKASGIGKEWNEQAAAFGDWAEGKTLDEVKGLKVKKVDDNHPQVPDVPELTSSVTITVGEEIESIAKAVANSK